MDRINANGANPAPVQPFDQAAAARIGPEIRQLRAADSIEPSASQSSWTDCPLNAAAYLLGCVFSIFTTIVGWIQAGIQRLWGAEENPAAAVAIPVPAANPGAQAPNMINHPLARIEDATREWQSDANFNHFIFPCKVFAVIKIYHEALGGAPVEHRFTKRYEQKNHETYQNDLQQFFSGIEDQLRLGNRQITRQTRVEMALVASHKRADNKWDIVTADEEFSAAGARSSGSGVHEEFAADHAHILYENLHGLDLSMAADLLDNPPVP